MPKGREWFANQFRRKRSKPPPSEPAPASSAKKFRLPKLPWLGLRGKKAPPQEEELVVEDFLEEEAPAHKPPEPREPRKLLRYLALALGAGALGGAALLLLGPRGREASMPAYSPPPPPPVTAPRSTPAVPVPTRPEVPGASQPPEAIEASEAPVPTPQKPKRNPFGDPEAPSVEKEKESASPPLPVPSLPAPLPAPPTAALPPPPPSPSGAAAAREAPPPPFPSVDCVGVFLGKEASAVVRAGGFEGVVSVGEKVPGVGKLIEVRPDGCVFSVGQRKLAVALEGEKRWE